MQTLHCFLFVSPSVHFQLGGEIHKKRGEKRGEGDVVLLGELKGHHTIWPEKKTDKPSE